MNFEELEVSKQGTPKLSWTGKLLIGLTGGVAIALSALCAPFVSPALRKFCLPYVPATDRQISNVLSALRKGSLLDLGSGDGRIVVEAARGGRLAHGVELNPWLVLYSRLDAFRKGVGPNTRFYRHDLWTYDVSRYDNVVIFGVEQMMSEVERKLMSECGNECTIIACRFPLPNERPTRTIGVGVDTVWQYKRRPSNGSIV